MTRDEICSKFIESITFNLYSYQEEALMAWFESPGGVMVCAPTGMGKPLIAKVVAFEAWHSHRPSKPGSLARWRVCYANQRAQEPRNGIHAPNQRGNLKSFI